MASSITEWQPSALGPERAVECVTPARKPSPCRALASRSSPQRISGLVVRQARMTMTTMIVAASKNAKPRPKGARQRREDRKRLA